MSKEKVLKLSGRKAYWGPAPSDTAPIDPSRLPDGYPYKEKSGGVVLDKNIVLGQEGDPYKFAENNPLKVDSEYIVTFKGEEYICNPIVTYDGDTLASVCVGNPAAVGFDNDNGLPFAFESNYANNFADIQFKVKEGILSEPEYFETGCYVKLVELSETIHPMAPEFLPAGVGGNDRDYLIDVTVDGDGAFVSETTFSDVWAAIEAGKVPVLYLHFVNGANGTPTTFKSYGCAIASTMVVFVVFVDMANASLKLDSSGWSLMS